MFSRLPAGNRRRQAGSDIFDLALQALRFFMCLSNIRSSLMQINNGRDNPAIIMMVFAPIGYGSGF